MSDPATNKPFECSESGRPIVEAATAHDGVVYESDFISNYLIEHDNESPTTGKKILATLYPAIHQTAQNTTWFENHPAFLGSDDHYLPRSFWNTFHSAIAEDDLKTFNELTQGEPRLLEYTLAEALDKGLTLAPSDKDRAYQDLAAKHGFTLAIENVAEKIESYYRSKMSEEEIAALPTPEVPEKFNCPVSHSIMDDPVMASDGIIYDRDSIEYCIGPFGDGKSPKTREDLTSELTPQPHLKEKIDAFLEAYSEHKEALETEEPQATRQPPPQAQPGSPPRALYHLTPRLITYYSISSAVRRVRQNKC